MMIDTIHCKVSFNGQIRRFALARNTEFISLKETIARLLSLNDEFVLKYRDDESDYVLLENQEEFKTALTLSSLLRIVVQPKNAPSSICDGQSQMYRKRQHHYHERKEHHHDHKDHHHDRKDKNQHHYHERKEHHHHHDHKDHHHDRKQKWHDQKVKSEEQRKLRSEKKLAFINQCLMDFGSDDSVLTPRALMKKQRLLKKKQRIESCIRGDCYNQRKRQGLITPEEEQHNLSIKSQILAVKMEASKVKARQREIKMLLQDKDETRRYSMNSPPCQNKRSSLRTKKELLLISFTFNQ
jgi:hypothetical protein